MTLDDIETALTARYVASFGELALPARTQYPNRRFESTGLALWSKVMFLPGAPQRLSLGTDGTERHDGIFQIDFHVPKATGNAELRRQVAAVRNVFKSGQLIRIAENRQALIMSVENTPGFYTGDFHVVSVSVNWRATLHLTDRNAEIVYLDEFLALVQSLEAVFPADWEQ